MGALGEILPGVEKVRGRAVTLDDVLEGRAKPKLLYLVGEVPFFERPDCEYVVAQDTYYPPFKVDAFLPASGFVEAEGTITNIEGRVQSLVRVEDLSDGAITGFTRPDWFIFGRIAEKLGYPGFDFKNSAAVLKEISSVVSGFPSKPDRKPRPLKSKTSIPISKHQTEIGGSGSYLLVAEPAGFRHRGIDLSSKVEGLEELALERGFRINPDDLRRLKVKPGDNIVISTDTFEVTGPVKSEPGCPTGTIFFFRPDTFGGLEHLSRLEPLYRISESPVRVHARPVKSTVEKTKKGARVRAAGVADGQRSRRA
jgi:anaerobic selenocysteine-containing dehydrogenase